MARLILVFLLLAAAVLVVALVSDRRGRRDAQLEGLRQAFLHGTPLPGSSRPLQLAEVLHPAGLRFQAPPTWAIDARQGEAAPPAASADGRRHVEVVRLDAPAGVSVTDALQRLAGQGPHAVETLPNGHVLMKSVEPVPGRDGGLACYTWRLGRVGPQGGIDVAEFRLRLPVQTAGDVIAQADLSMLDRSVREATFGEPRSASPAG